MTDLEHLNKDSREALGRRLAGMTVAVFAIEDLPTLLCANFLREISDTLARIDEKLGGIEMNGRPGP